MKGDTKVIEYLNQGLRHELTAVNQFWLHYRLFDNWGYNQGCSTLCLRGTARTAP